MSDDQNLTTHELHLVGVADLRKRWGWCVGVGAALVILGMVALSTSVLVTLGTMVMFGWLMVLAGLLQTAHGFTNRAWGGFFVELLAGILSAVAGTLIVAHPAVTAEALTLMIAMLLIIGGIFRIVVSLSVRFPNTVWLLIHGVVNVLLGMMIIQVWPISGLWVIGTFIGIDLIFNGWTLVMLGLAARGMK
jgi:uncharacterized membrane protein HdeD (DUF308 family)